MLKLFFTFSSLLLPSMAFASGATYFAPLAQQLALGEHVITLVFVAMVFLVMGGVYRLKTAGLSNPFGYDPRISFKNIFEGLGEFVYGLCVSTMGEKEARTYFPVILFTFTFVFFNNSIGLIPGFLPPTDNINTTVALGIFIFLYYNYQGIRVQGLWGHIKHFMGPVWYLAFLIFPIEIISHFFRPMSLGLRLRGNIYGDHMVIAQFSNLSEWLVPMPFLVVGLFVCFIQAFVFTLLSMVYISMATEHHDHDEGGH